MKKSLLALAVAAAVSPAAFAQTNVTLYGIADAGISGDRTGAPGGGTAVRINSGYMSTSRFGITGTEDLGAGLKGVFTLELGYSIDNGGFSTYNGTPGQTVASGVLVTTPIAAGFNRRSFVGLQGGFGTVALGRDYTPYFWAQLATDTLGYGLYGNLLNSTQLSGTGSEQFLRASNAIFYTSPKFGGLTIRGMVSAGSEVFGSNAAGALPRTANQMYGLGADYNLGPLTIAAAYQEARLPRVNAAGTAFQGGTNNRKDWVVGGKYNFGVFSLNAGYARVDPANNTAPVTLSNGAAGFRNNSQQYWVGGTVAVGKGSILAQWNRIDQTYNTGPKGKTDTFSLAYTYPFSRRTTGYASLGYARNNNQAGVGLFASDNSVPAGALGADPRGIVVGVRHSF